MEQRLTWEEIQSRYPDQWVVLEDAEIDGSTLLSGIVVYACSDEEIDDYFFRAVKEGKHYIKRRTSEFPGAGVVHGANFRVVVG